MTGRALRSIRLALSLTINEFADRISISAVELDAFERGDKTFDPRRLSAALERLAPDMEKLDNVDPLLRVPLIPLSHHAGN